MPLSALAETLGWVAAIALGACTGVTGEDDAALASADAALDAAADAVDGAADGGGDVPSDGVAIDVGVLPPRGACVDDADCAGLWPRDFCRDAPTCDKAAQPPVCRAPTAQRVVCPAKGPCTAGACDPATGACAVVAADGGLPCDDGDPCSVDSACAAGVCGGGSAVCPCTKDADCAAVDDANACNGTLFCDISGASAGGIPSCKVAPASKPTCPKADAGSCSTWTCAPTDGSCKSVVAPGGSPCDDGDPCSQSDVCVAGACTAGVAVCGCKTTADCKGKDNGDLCDGSLYCDILAKPPVCKVFPKSIVVCDASADGPCMTTSCAKDAGACVTLPVAASVACDDGDGCSAGDTCQGGACVASAAICPCTSDADCAAKNPKDLCLGTLYCDKSVAGAFTCKLNPATPVVCPSANDGPCATHRCQPKTGTCALQARPDGSSCNADGNPCTLGDACTAGVCAAGPNVCPCQADGECAAYEDGDVCNGTLMCAASAAAGGKACAVAPNTVKSCVGVAPGPCLALACEAATGDCKAKAVADATPCDADGNVCTVGDHCVAGTCEVGVAACACKGDTDCVAFDDGDLCNGTMFCDKSATPFACVPKPASAVTCDTSADGPCDQSVCAPKLGTCGKQPLDQNTPCEDGSPCTVGDSCKAGACVSGKGICACTKSADCAAAEDGDLCNGTLHCDLEALPHVCKITAATVVTCPPAAPCTTVACDAKTGTCVAGPLAAAGSPCDDNDVCTEATVCSGGLCTQGTAKACDDGNPCTFDGCAHPAGCTPQPSSGAACKLPGGAPGFCVKGLCAPGPP